MKKYIIEYFSFIESGSKDFALMSEDEKKDFLSELLKHIKFIQHERLIHLIVLCLFAIIFFICITSFVCFQAYILIPIVVLVLALLVPYIMHYYFLENSTQKLYRIYDELNKK